MEAVLVFRDKKVKWGLIIEMVVWELDSPLKGCRHRFKYVCFAADWKPANLLSGTTMKVERVTTDMPEMWSNLTPSLILKSCLPTSKKT